MYKFKHKLKTYSIPSGWSELTLGQWKELQKTDEQNKVISILSGLPEDLVKKLDDKSLFNLNRLLSFISVPLDIDEFEAPEILSVKIKNKTIKIPLVEDIRTKTFGQKIYSQKSFENTKEDIYKIVVDIVLIYSQPTIENKKFDVANFKELALYFDNLFLVDLYATGMFYLAQLKDIIELEAKTLSSNPTPEQSAAGIDRFNQFGIMNTVRAMAKGDPLKYERVLELDYNTAFTHMVMNKVTSDFQDDYREVMKRKNK